MDLCGYLVYLYPDVITDVAGSAFLTAMQREGFLALIVWDQQARHLRRRSRRRNHICFVRRRAYGL